MSLPAQSLITMELYLCPGAILARKAVIWHGGFRVGGLGRV